MTISSSSTLPLSLLEFTACGTFTSWPSSACTLRHTSVGQLKQVSFYSLMFDSLFFYLFFNANICIGGQDETNEEIEFAPLPTEPSELSSLTAMIKKTATD